VHLIEEVEMMKVVGMPSGTPAGNTRDVAKSHRLAKVAVVAASASRQHDGQVEFERKGEREMKHGSHIFRKWLTGSAKCASNDLERQGNIKPGNISKGMDLQSSSTDVERINRETIKQKTQWADNPLVSVVIVAPAVMKVASHVTNVIISFVSVDDDDRMDSVTEDQLREMILGTNEPAPMVVVRGSSSAAADNEISANSKVDVERRLKVHKMLADWERFV